MRRTFWPTALLALALTGSVAGCSADGPAPSSGGTPSNGNDAPQVDSKSDASETLAAILEQMPSDSILRVDEQDGTKRLMADLEAGKVPTSCTALYDQMGSLPDVTVTDEASVLELLGLVSNIRVVGTSDMSITDSYHFVSFTLQDGSTMGYRFEGEGNLVTSAGNRWVQGDGPLWARVRELQGAKTGGGTGNSGTGDSLHSITLVDDDKIVTSCPTSARAGDVVAISTYEVLDADVVVKVDGTKVTRAGYAFAFEMPDHPVTVTVEVHGYDFGS